MSSGGRPLARGDGETPRLCEILRDEAVGVLLWPWFYDGAHRPFCDRLRLGPGKMRMPWRRGEMTVSHNLLAAVFRLIEGPRFGLIKYIRLLWPLSNINALR